MSEFVDKDTALKNENNFYAMLLFIVLFLGSIINVSVEYMLLKQPLFIVIRNSIILLTISILVVYINSLKNEVLKMYLYSIIVSLVFIFCYYEFYASIGPSVNSLGLLFLLTLLVYSRIEVLLVYFSVFLMTLLTSSKELKAYDNWMGYSISEIVILLMIMGAALFVYRVYESRQRKIESQYNEILLSREKLQATLIAVGDGVISINNKGIIEYMNPVAENLTAWNKNEAIGLQCEDVFRVFNEDSGSIIDNHIRMIEDRNTSIERTNDIYLISKDNREIFIESTASSIKTPSGDIIGVLIIFKDVTERRERSKKIEFLSYCDHLTGLYNRRYYEDELKRLDEESNLPLSFVFSDVNGLKVINDAFGHEAGDDLIKIVAKVIKEQARSSDIISRIGGDEFVMILPNTDNDTAMEIVENIERKLSSKQIRSVNVSVSFGIGTKEDMNQKTMEIVKSAEDIMYNNKILKSENKKKSVIHSIYMYLIEDNIYEEKHSKSVGVICEEVGRLLKLDEDTIRDLRIAGEFHDIGKITLDKSILLKKEDLTEAEWSNLREHVEVGYRLLSTSNEYRNIAHFIRYHHENWDGSGYPHGLKKEEIPLQSRIITLADAYDFMTKDKPYGKALSLEDAIDEIKRSSGITFDPDLVEVFIEEYLKK
jgi:diguanylate cyclase (GGDEF)-like protein/PAS domain S-box-containing protein